MQKLIMKAVSLWQPWASFVLWGYKNIETRSWPLPKGFNGPLAIHAAKKVISFIHNPYFDDIMMERNLEYNDLPQGFILCYFERVTCEKITRHNIPDYPERAYGDYTPGRYMWKLEGRHVLPIPLYYRGRQKIWDWMSEDKKKNRQMELFK